MIHQRLNFLEQYDLDLAGFTPWVVDVLAVGDTRSHASISEFHFEIFVVCFIIGKPLERPDEVLDMQDPGSYYFIYVCKKVSQSSLLSR